MNIDEAFGAVLRELREHQGLTQDAFGTAASRQYIHRLEKGEHSPTLDRVEQIAQVLGVDAVVLILWAYDRVSEKPVGHTGKRANQALAKLIDDLCLRP
ncbi:helix-turn-helix transcriptional regulator [Pseudomonas viridiflava]|uniref:helix-turn-helix domain-containing protein n=1 Tax=Pseudomonas viridiflava TaxID=33069 RepID=UPI002E9C7872|nr:helix-turn-helix transcriptional regulator [Pseudomonas viridiflava]